MSQLLYLLPIITVCNGCPWERLKEAKKTVVGWRSLCGASERLAPTANLLISHIIN
ncbi:MAG: hypothetical protein RLZZ338_524 [Cyanobacteriota bacterium]|jgi:hypothetical protein